MASLAQKRGSCGHVMALFDNHSRCAHCCEKGQGLDPCVLKKECSFCDALTPEQIIQLATPTYQICKERKAKADKQTEFIDPADITVISVIGSNSNDKETVSSELRSPHIQQDSSFKQELVDLKDEIRQD